MASRDRPGAARRGIRWWLVTVAALALIPLLAFAVACVLSLVERQRSATVEALKDHARALSLAADQQLETSITALQGLATARTLTGGNYSAFREQLETVRAKVDRIWWTAGVLDGAGHVVLSLEPPVGELIASIAQREDFRAAVAAQRPWISDRLLASRVPATILIAVPAGPAGARGPVLVAAVRADGLATTLAQQRLPEGASAYLLDRQNVPVVRLPGTDPEQATPLSQDLMAKQGRAWEGFAKLPATGGQTVYAAFTRSPTSNWTVMVVVPETAFNAPLRRWLWTVVGGGLVLLVVGVGLASLVARRIASAISGLAVDARALGRGEAPRAGTFAIAEVDEVGQAIAEAAVTRQHAEDTLRTSEARYRAIVEDQAELVCRFSPSGSLTFVNEAFERVFARPRDELMGESFIAMLHPEDRARMASNLALLGPGQAAVTIESRLVGADGSIRWTQWTSRAICEGDGQVVEVQAVGRDITARKMAEQALARITEDLAARARRQAAVAQLGQRALAGTDLISLLEEAVKLLCGVLGSEFCRVLELSADGRRLETRAAVGWPVGTPVVVPAMNAEAQLALRTLEPVVIDLEQDERFRAASHLRSCGIRSGMSVVILGGPGPYGLLSMHTANRRTFTPDDVIFLQSVANILANAIARARAETERSELLQRAQQAQAAAEEANRAKDEFLAMLGHELRNPLAAIVNAGRVLEETQAGDDRTVQLGSIIARQSDHLSRMVGDLLDVSRLGSGKIVLRREAVDLKDVVERSVASFREAGRTERHQLAVEAESVPVYGDPTRLEQIVWNLLDNALKYTPPGGGIEVTIRRDRSTARLGVRDTGVGIAPDILPHVFELFVQAPRSLDRAEGGLGLGLTLVRRLAELHGGGVAAFSEGSGHGSEFIVRLPATAVVARTAPASAPEAPVSHERRRVLLVEDNLDTREALALLLENWGHEVQQAGDGESALVGIAADWPEVALVDVGLPGMDGYTLARRLRAMPEGAGIVLIALTGYSREEDRRRAREAGFDAYLVKPVDPDALMRILGELDGDPSRRDR